MEANISIDSILKASNKMPSEESIIIWITRILSQTKEFPFILFHGHIALLELMILIRTSLIVLIRQELLPKPLLKDLLGEIHNTNLELNTLHVPPYGPIISQLRDGTMSFNIARIRMQQEATY